MLVFHETYIGIPYREKLSGIYNQYQIDAEKLFTNVMEHRESYNKVAKVRSGQYLELNRVLTSTNELTVFYTIMLSLESQEGLFRSSITHLKNVTHSDEYSIKKVLYFLEKIKLISISDDALFEIKYFNE